jgi:hypothetical protein
VPFGDVELCRDLLGLQAAGGQTENLTLARSEHSGDIVLHAVPLHDLLKSASATDSFSSH